MRIVQTFWTAGRNPLEYSFGWLHPEYNLMSWALSCLSLREHYDEVALYTDTRGKEVLIDLLHLPYTEVHVVFDDFPCLPQHWALSKIKTYSLQDKPFLHVDGDVYLPKPIDPAILDAPLVAQNREIGTGYYRRMMNRILSYTEITMPPYIEKGLEEKSIASYNMGIFGGTDIEFIQRYCNEVFSFMDGNEMNNARCRQSAVDCNVFFEQVIFAVLADRENREVASVLGRPMRDEGYTGREFCDLLHFRDHPFFHVLGGHKRKQGVCNDLERTLLKNHFDLFCSIISYFPGWRNSDINDCKVLSIERCIAQYEDFVNDFIIETKSITFQELLNYSRDSTISLNAYINRKKEAKWQITCNPWTKIFHIDTDFNPYAINLIKRKIGCDRRHPLFRIVLIPSLLRTGYKECLLSDIGYRIYTYAKSKGAIGLQSLVQNFLAEHFPRVTLKERDILKGIIHKEIDRLLCDNILSLT